MTAPKITVLMSVLNGEAFLREAMDSVFNQSFEDFEFLVIDNASTDGTAAILKSYDDPRLRVLRNDAVLTLTQSLNKGLAHAKGGYVARLDADDIAMPERLEQQAGFLDTHPEVALAASAWFDFDDVTPPPGVPAPVPPTDHRDLLAALASDNVLAHSTLCFRRACVQEAGGYPEAFEYAMEYALYFRLAEHHRLAALPQPLVAIRNHSAQITQAPSWHVKRLQENLMAARIAAACPALTPRDRRNARDHCIRLATRLAMMHFKTLDIPSGLRCAFYAVGKAPWTFVRVAGRALFDRMRRSLFGTEHA
jgi:glycosyltransferase involved in cell wall biosynthesis